MAFPTPTEAQRALARASRRGRSAQDRDNAQRDLAAAKIADSIRANVDKWPPLTEDQRAALAALLTGEAA